MTTPIRSFEDLIVWQKSVDMCQTIYEVSAQFPSDERFGLVSQIRRSAVSIPSNIAEGYGRGTPAEYSRFLRVARGSLYEVETQLIIAARLGFIPADRFKEIRELTKECGRILAGLLRSIENADGASS